MLFFFKSGAIITSDQIHMELLFGVTGIVMCGVGWRESEKINVGLREEE